VSESSSSSHTVATAWAELIAGLNAHSTLRDDTPRFSDYALGRFDPRVVIERLLAPEPTYFAHMDIVRAVENRCKSCRPFHPFR